MTTKTIVFIDSRVAGYQSLIDSLEPGTQWGLLKTDQDGVLRIRDYLEQHKATSAVSVRRTHLQQMN